MRRELARRRVEVLSNHLLSGSRQAPSCGIIGVVSKNENVTPLVVQGLNILQNRGYDSAGVAGCNGEKILLEKCASKESTNDAIERISQLCASMQSTVAMGHTRWATHGGRTDENAHPHVDQSGRIALVHNGIIENSEKIKERLIENHQVAFTSETDTEVVVQLIGLYMRSEGLNVADAYEKASAELKGTWGFVILDAAHPDQLFVASKGSPLLIGIGKNRMFVASEASAFSKYTKQYIALSYGESAIVTSEGHSLMDAKVLEADNEVIDLSPDPFPHWTLKEIMEQPISIQKALSHGARIMSDVEVKLGGLDSHKEALLEIHHLVICACGTSLYAGAFGAKFMRTLKAFESVTLVDAAELGPDDLPEKMGGMLVISQSGETKDVHRAMELAQTMNIPVFGAVNRVGSLIARSALCGTYIHAGRENGVASTKAFPCQSTVLILMALWFTQNKNPSENLGPRGSVIDALHRLPTMAGMALRLREKCQVIARGILATKQHSLFVLGKGMAHPIALEGALKIKEISYLHAEGYSAGALKHGPYALIEEGVSVIFILLSDKHASFVKTAIAEVHSRKANVIVITDDGNNVPREVKATNVLKVPKNGALSALTAVVPLQMIGYELSVLQGINPDRPRNLAKAVTVD